MDLIHLLSEIALQYKLNPDGAHGLSHWARVLENGMRLAEIEGGDRTVIRLFAIFHDAATIKPGIQAMASGEPYWLASCFGDIPESAPNNFNYCRLPAEIIQMEKPRLS